MKNQNSFDGLLHLEVSIVTMECCITTFIIPPDESRSGGVRPNGATDWQTARQPNHSFSTPETVYPGQPTNIPNDGSQDSKL
jgi:hypothetical protein